MKRTRVLLVPIGPFMGLKETVLVPEIGVRPQKFLGASFCSTVQGIEPKKMPMTGDI